MKLAVFVSEYNITVDTLDRLKADKLGIIFVQNGVYHAAVKDGGKDSPVMDRSASFYALTEDLDTRGLGGTELAGGVNPVSYGDVVDLIFNDYDKVVWL